MVGRRVILIAALAVLAGCSQTVTAPAKEAPEGANRSSSVESDSLETTSTNSTTTAESDTTSTGGGSRAGGGFIGAG